MLWDTELFLLLNFDGGALMDRGMLFASGKISWVIYYLFILFLVWRRFRRWFSPLLAALSIGIAVGISDLVAGVFKHSGPLKNLWESFPARLRPMHTPELEGVVHSITDGGLYGTVSAHAATATAIALVASLIIRKRWFTIAAFMQLAMVCYSRIYLGYHFPQDILLGFGIGLLSGYTSYRLFNSLNTKLIDNAQR